jgi:predicted TPR repeat methyltransferase
MNDLQNIFSAAIHYHQQGLLEEAKVGYFQVLEVLPDNVSVLGNMGIVCRDLGDLENALHYCLRAAEAAPEDATQLINLGAVYESLGRMADARQCYENALRYVPTHPKALNNLGKLLHLAGETGKGLELIRKSVTIEPSSPLALNNLGVILSAIGDNGGAISYIERSLQLEPKNTETMYNLAGLYNCDGQNSAAVELLEKLLKLCPDHSPASHMLSALKGEVTESAPARYIAETFDKYAGRFDQHIRDSLGYTVPDVMAEMVAEAFTHRKFSEGLDLGCGTGLSGSAFSGLTQRLTGVDLSTQMLDRAAEKKIYAQLECAEVLSFLESAVQRYDLFIITDVLIYVGKIEPLLSAITRVARPNAVIACSIERFEGAGKYTLCQSGRYAHSREYLTTSAESAGFPVIAHQEHGIRKENNTWIPGDLYVLQKND